MSTEKDSSVNTSSSEDKGVPNSDETPERAISRCRESSRRKTPTPDKEKVKRLAMLFEALPTIPNLSRKKVRYFLMTFCFLKLLKLRCNDTCECSVSRLFKPCSLLYSTHLLLSFARLIIKHFLGKSLVKNA